MPIPKRIAARAPLHLAFPTAPQRPLIRFEDVFRQARAKNVLDLRGIGRLLRPVGATAAVPAPRDFGLPNNRVGSVPSLPPPRRFPLTSEGSGTTGVTLPYGLTRFIRASVLKRIAGGRVTDRLLRRTPSGQWAFVENTEVIDLSDATQVFKLGKLAIFS
jgi:hypothetical protein